MDIPTAAWIEDGEIRAAYGAATLQYTIAVALTTAREQRHLSQATLAARAGVSQAYLAKVERGDANPTLRRLGALFAALGLQAKVCLTPLSS